MAAKSVFISHSSKDDGVVRELRHALELRGIRVWADSEELKGGDALEPRIRTEIDGSDAVLVVLSIAALNSKWVQREIKYALSLKKPVIPLLRSGVEVGALGLLFDEEPVAISIESVMHAMPYIMAALGHQLPTEVQPRVPAAAKALSNLVLHLDRPAILEADGTRRATAEAKLVYTRADGHEVEGDPYGFTSPLGPIEAEELAWYLERYINWPSGLFDDRAHRVVDSLPVWGRLLYDSVHVEVSRKALEAWKADPSERRFTVRVDKRLIAGAPLEKQNEANEAATLLLALPWELIHDEHSYLFQGKRPVRVRRSLPNRHVQEAVATKPPIRVLLVSPRPEDDSAAYIDHRVSARPLVEALSRLGTLAYFKLLEPPTFPALEAELIRAAEAGEPYHVVHFDGHGVYDRRHGLGMLCFEDPADLGKLEKRRSQLVGADEIARIVREHRIPLFFLEACQSAKTEADPGTSVAGRLLESGVASVAAMSHSVLVETARIFIADFYKELLTGKRVGQAMLAGQRALKAETFRGKSFAGEVKLHDWFVPVLFQEEQDPQLIFEVPAAQVEAEIARHKKEAHGGLPEPPEHQFLGRSRDLLKAERLLAERKYLVVLGSGGEGKTTFAAELARWLLATCRVERVAFTSVETISEARQVLHSVGGQLVADFETRVGTDDGLGLQFVERALREHRTVVVIDNVESILGLPVLGEILELCRKLGQVGETRLVFTSREVLPAPFDSARQTMRIGRLDRDSAIRLLGNALSIPPRSDESEQDLRDLVDAVGGHARSLVLIAREVGLAGVRHATRNLRAVMEAIDAKRPGDRENSLLASAELSLRRLPDWIREKVRGLSVFQGGGGVPAISEALALDQDQLNAVVNALIGVGLAEYVEPQYLRFDPALISGKLADEEPEAATRAWAEAMKAELQYCYWALSRDPNLALNLAGLELPNFLAALEYFSDQASPEQVVSAATSLEQFASSLRRGRVLSRIIQIRARAAKRIVEWSHAQYLARAAAVDRLGDQGRVIEALEAAEELHNACAAAGDAAYEGAAYDGATAELRLGSAQQTFGDADAALVHLENARRRFELLGNSARVGQAVGHKANCLNDLARYGEAADAYKFAIKSAEEQGDLRSAAVYRFQLGTTRLMQRNYQEALRMYTGSRESFERLNEPISVAAVWHQIGRVFASTKQLDLAESAYLKSFNIEVQCGNRQGQGESLSALGILYGKMDRFEEAVRLHRQAADVAIELGDLKSEGLRRNNAAADLLKLARFDEARIELVRAIECQRPFGHVSSPWTTFGILSVLEVAVGNRPAALVSCPINRFI
jgi:tetratricopeptide (TPR) repeat protein